MLKVVEENFPSPEQWRLAIEGMRYPMKSISRMDSFIANNDYCFNTSDKDCNICPYHGDFDKDGYTCSGTSNDPELFVLGEGDKKLLLNLCSQGDPSHRKVLRQLPVQLTIEAPLYWWKQMDQYRIGATTNSESTMHTLTKSPFTIYDFATEYIVNVDEPTHNGTYLNYFISCIIDDLNYLRNKYLETNDDQYWYALNAILPQNYIQTRLWTGSYENLINIINQRTGHRLPEWTNLIDYLLINAPYLKEINEACQTKERIYKKLIEENKELKKKISEYAGIETTK